MSRINITSETNLSLMKDSLLIRDRVNVLNIINLKEFKHLNSWENNIYREDGKPAGEKEHGTTLIIGGEPKSLKNGFNDNFRSQIVFVAENQNLRNEFNNKIYNFLYFYNFVLNKTIRFIQSNEDITTSILLREIFQISREYSENKLIVITSRTEKEILLKDTFHINVVSNVIEKLMNVYSYTNEEISEEKVSLITKTLESVKNTPLVIFD